MTYRTAQVGVIDTGISLNHQDLQRNINKDCQDFVNGDDSCDEGRISGNSKGAPLWHRRRFTHYLPAHERLFVRHQSCHSSPCSTRHSSTGPQPAMHPHLQKRRLRKSRRVSSDDPTARRQTSTRGSP